MTSRLPLSPFHSPFGLATLTPATPGVKVGAQPKTPGHWAVASGHSTLKPAACGNIPGLAQRRDISHKEINPHSTLDRLELRIHISHSHLSFFLPLDGTPRNPPSPSLLDLPIFCFSPHLRSVQLLQNPSLSTCGTTPRDETPPHLACPSSRHVVRCPLVRPDGLASQAPSPRGTYQKPASSHKPLWLALSTTGQRGAWAVDRTGESRRGRGRARMTNLL